MSWTSGEKLDTTRLRRLSEAIPTSYTVWKDGSQAKAECNIAGGTDYLTGTDSAVIQSAINALTGGRTWKEKVALKGDFSISSAISIPSYTVLEILGQLKLANSVNDYILKNSSSVAGNTQIDIIGGVLDGNKTNNSGKHCIIFDGAKNSKILNVEVKNASDSGIFVGTGNSLWSKILDNEVAGCYVHDNYSYGISVAYYSWFNKVHDNVCVDNGHTTPINSGFGIFLWLDCSYNLVVDNVCRGNYDGGIGSQYSAATYNMYNTIARNKIYGNQTSGYDAISFSRTRHSKILENTVVNPWGNGIYISTDCDDNEISYNTVIGADQGAGAGNESSIYFNAGDRNDVHHNKLNSPNCTYEIYVAGSDNRISPTNRLLSALSVYDGGTNTRFAEVPFKAIFDDSDANASLSNLGDHVTISCADNQDATVRFGFKVPFDFQRLIRAGLIVASPCTGGTTLRWNVATDFGYEGQLYNTHSDSISSTDTTLAANYLKLLDLTDALTGIDLKDVVGIAFQREGSHANDTLGSVLHVLQGYMQYI